MIKSFTLFLLNLVLGIILLCTPYIHYSNLELRMVLVSTHLEEVRCIHELPLLSLIDFVLTAIAGFILHN